MAAAAQDKRVAIISFDGLRAEQFERMRHYLPKFTECLADHKLVAMDSRPFVAPQAIWAEILTGSPWYENGCSGYSQPDRSLNHLHICTERDLLKPLAPLFNDRPGIAINIPLLLPRENIAWLSDGSMPVEHIVAPRLLAEKPPFSQYQARGFAYLPFALVTARLASATCFSIEKTRLECAVELAKDDKYEWIALRLSIFDELSHLFGEGWLDEPGLWVRPQLEEFLASADALLATICQGTTTFLISSFSHEFCRSTFNLNLFLQRNGFLRLYSDETQMAPARAEGRRADAIEAIMGHEIRRNRLQSNEGLFLAEQSSAAAPVAGCIYVNDRERFADGRVPADQRDTVKRKVLDLLKKRLGENSPGFEVYEAPARTAANSSAIIPDAIVVIPNVELTDALVPPGINNRHRSTHAARGFAYLPKFVAKEQSSMRPSQLTETIMEPKRSGTQTR